MADEMQRSAAERSRPARVTTAKIAPNGHVVVLDLHRGREWLTGSISSDEYFDDAIEAAGEEARDEVRQLIRSAS